MQNYYELLNVSSSASDEEIRRLLNGELRKWTQRTNSPSFEKRQEAERMVRLLEQVEATLLDPEKRREYDQSLKDYTLKLTATSVDDDTTSSSNQSQIDLAEIQQEIGLGWELLKQGRVADALILAQKVIDQVPNYAEAWTLMGQACYQNNDTNEAIRAIRQACELEPRPAYFTFLGDVYYNLKDLNQAERAYIRALEMDYQDLSVVYKLGVLYSEMGQWQKAIDYLGRCRQSAPNDPAVNRQLGTTYFRFATKDWTSISTGNSFLPAGIYPIDSNVNLKTSESLLNQAKIYSFSDPVLQTQIDSALDNIKLLQKRQFTGSWTWVVLIPLLVILNIWFVSDEYAVAARELDFPLLSNYVALFLYPILYIISAYAPGWRIFQQVTQGKSYRSDFAFLYEWLRNRIGKVGSFFIMFILFFLMFFIWVLVVPIVIFRNLYHNYLKKRSVW
jgi:tetratricopeptide (TPR) repeat protein